MTVVRRTEDTRLYTGFIQDSCPIGTYGGVDDDGDPSVYI